MEDDVCPELRPVEIVPFEQQGQTLYVLKDPHELNDQTPVMTPIARWLIQFFDGRTTQRSVRETYREQTGDDLPEGILEELIEVLDEHYLLDNERSQDLQKEQFSSFLERDSRPATLPGRAVPDRAEDLRTFFDDAFSPPEQDDSGNRPKGLIVPHIDFQRGRETYEQVLPHLKRMNQVDRLIFLGICHNLAPRPFALTYKTFQSPFGDVSVDEEGVSRLDAMLPYDVTEGEIAHRLEHSIEIPLLLTQYALPDTSFRIVPLLCSYRSQEEHNTLLNRITTELGRLLDTPGTALIAGVDFAHKGTQFGDLEPLSSEDYRTIEEADREMLEHILEGQASQFERHIQANDNARRVCGYPALRTLLPLFNRGSLIDYGQSRDPDCTVTFGAATLR